MVITIVEANVPREKWQDLEQAYKEKTKHAPPKLRETFLIHDRDYPEVWRVISIWRSIEAYEEVVNLAIYDTCMVIFRAVGAQPTRRIFDVPAHHLQI